MTERDPQGLLKPMIAAALLFVGGLVILLSAGPFTGDPDWQNLLGGGVMVGVAVLYYLMVRRMTRRR
ncbi:hypothetical protein [Nocardiopsis sp. L17-MgMaSL7]|uniref:hypothetical protein n=1 Tax=Nocardiopsis sp. L17-MgMaSL7 TaxID=1938893 RepID=UPI000D709485|nr:hypothetical protein [Nocardiopsis sp. L17-MgMaSL7]PWV47951.1 hypothetical protein BDW27_111145 [Nocardiopsis sp. L17-MgMaSL7]